MSKNKIVKEEAGLNTTNSDTQLKDSKKAVRMWDSIFFISLLVTSFITAFIVKDINRHSIWTYIIGGIVVPFFLGAFSSIFKSMILRTEPGFKLNVFIKETYLRRIEKSTINPKNQND